jgi:hypothetical protein
MERQKSFRVIAKLLVAIITLMMVAFTFSGCAKKVTIESLFKDSKKAYDNVTSLEATIEINVDGSLYAQETTMKAMLLSTLSAMVEKEKGFYVNGEFNYEALGMMRDDRLEIYSSLDKKNPATYTYNPFDKSWTKNSTDYSEDLDMDALTKLEKPAFEKAYKKLSLADGTRTFHGKKTYCVFGDITGVDLQPILDQAQKNLENSTASSLDTTDMLDSLGLDEDMLKALVISVEFYFTKKDSRLMGVKLDFGKTDFGKLIPNTDSDEPSLLGQIAVDLKVCSISFVIGNVNSYKYKVPKSVKDKAVDEEAYDYEDDDFDDFEFEDYDEDYDYKDFN